MRTEGPSRPLPNAYWVSPGRFLAGGYPGPGSKVETRLALRSLLLAGLTFFLDLTEEGEYGVEPYAAVLDEEARSLGRSVEYRRIPIPDADVPTIEDMVRILDMIDAALAEGRAVYVHCFAGVGRTATAVGCYLVRHGLEGQAALREVHRLRYGRRVLWKRPGPNLPQQAMVRNWPAGM
jgi:Polymorphic toxin system, DSP-PTPase phosphatase